MRICVVGASGTLGKAVVAALADRHEVIEASRSGAHRVDLLDPASVTALYDEVGPLDAVACTAGKTPFAPLADLTREQFVAGLTDKVLGQVELVRQGASRLSDGGSFTLIGGVLGDEPILKGTVASTVNGALNAFAMAAATELPRGLRINVVSPTVFEESWESYGPFFPGHRPVSVVEAARAYVKAIEGRLTGKVLRVGY